MIIRPVPFLLAPGVLALVAAAGLYLFGSTQWTAPAPVRPDLSATASVAALASGSGEAYAEQAARPLLNPTRRPEPRGQAPDAGIIGDLEILGLLGTTEKNGVVILHNTKTRESSRLRIGQSLSGWRLDAIKPRAAVFSSAQGQRELPLKRQSQPQSAAPAPTAVQSGSQPAPATSR